MTKRVANQRLPDASKNLAVDSIEKIFVSDICAKNKRNKPTMKSFSGAIKTIHALNPEDNTTLLNATFSNGAFECHGLADKGADANIVGQSVLNALTTAANVNFCVRNLPNPKCTLPLARTFV